MMYLCNNVVFKTNIDSYSWVFTAHGSFNWQRLTMKRGLLEVETLGSGSSYQRFVAGPQHPLTTTPLNTELWHKLEMHVEDVYLAVIWLQTKLNLCIHFHLHSY